MLGFEQRVGASVLDFGQAEDSGSGREGGAWSAASAALTDSGEMDKSFVRVATADLVCWIGSARPFPPGAVGGKGTLCW